MLEDALRRALEGHIELPRSTWHAVAFSRWTRGDVCVYLLKANHFPRAQVLTVADTGDQPRTFVLDGGDQLEVVWWAQQLATMELNRARWVQDAARMAEGAVRNMMHDFPTVSYAFLYQIS